MITEKKLPIERGPLTPGERAKIRAEPEIKMARARAQRRMEMERELGQVIEHEPVVPRPSIGPKETC